MISSISGGAQAWTRPDPAKMAGKLFSELDTKGQGYIDKSDLQAAFDQASRTGTSGSGSTSGVDDVFKQLDGNGDGKVTEAELSDGLKNLMSQLDGQMQYMGKGGMSGAAGASAGTGDMSGGPGGMGGMPPPPPPAGSAGASGDADSGFTKDQLTSMASAASGTDSKRASFMSELASNFDKADANGDGKITRDEALGYARDKQGAQSATARSTGAAASSTTNTAAATDTAATSDSSTEAAIMKKILLLMHAYGQGVNPASGQASASFAVSA